MGAFARPTYAMHVYNNRQMPVHNGLLGQVHKEDCQPHKMYGNIAMM